MNEGRPPILHIQFPRNWDGKADDPYYNPKVSVFDELGVRLKDQRFVVLQQCVHRSWGGHYGSVATSGSK